MDTVLDALSTYGYIILFFYSLGGGFVAITAAGVLSYAGKMDLTTSIVVAVVANAIGDTLLFYISRYNQEMIKPYLKKHRRKLALSHVLMKRYGSWIIFFQKFVYGIKTLIPIAIGLTKYSFFKFNILNVISAVIWGLVFGVGSYLSGAFFIKAVSVVSDKPWIAPLILGFFIFIIWQYLQFATKKRVKR